MNEELRQAISEIFGYVDKTDLKASGDTVTFETESEEITYDKLCALSALLGTTKISLHAETRGGGGCPTCAYDYGVTVIKAKEVARRSHPTRA